MRSTSNFNRLGDFQVDFENLFDHILGNQPTSSALKLVPPANVVESETGYTLVMELAGVPSEDVSIEMKENLLEISGEKKVADVEEGQRMAKSERRGGAFTRKFEFGVQVDAEAITAQFKDGLLTISLPKSEKAQARKIQIQTS